jgi:hypothetical protein
MRNAPNIIIKIKNIKETFIYPEYPRLFSENSLKSFKREFISEVSEVLVTARDNWFSTHD